RVTKIRTFEVIDRAGIDKVRNYLWNRGEPGKPGGIVTFSSRSSGWKINTNYTGPSATGYKALLTQLAPDGAHAMTIVGYDDLVEFTAPDGILTKGAFIVCNTWGEDHFAHDRGRYYLPYYFWEQSDRTNSELSRDMCGTDVEYREPKVVFRVKLNYTSRNDLSFRIGVSNKASDNIPVHDYLVPIANYQGGDYPMQGSSGSSEIEFAFDFSSYVQNIHDSEEPKFFLTVSRNKRGRELGTGKMLAFSVYDYRENPSFPKVYVCNDIAGKEIKSGNNIFSIETVAAKTTSYSKVQWLGQSGQPAAAPLVLKTADGKYVKMRFSDYNRQDGTIKLKYVYAPDGSLKLE
ncbi:MAG: thiol protease, partial [Bacteroides sp.]|nr:thiol protease [Bacteroides sp.]